MVLEKGFPKWIAQMAKIGFREDRVPPYQEDEKEGDINDGKEKIKEWLIKKAGGKRGVGEGGGSDAGESRASCGESTTTTKLKAAFRDAADVMQVLLSARQDATSLAKTLRTRP
jgi:hypothetical protein